GFNKEGFEIVAAFDADITRPRPSLPDIPLYPMAELGPFVRNHQVKMAILTVPASSAQQVLNELVAAGIQAVLNFSPVVLDVPDHVAVSNVDLAVELENLSYFIR